ncbi:MAG: hypothetical protein N2486_03270 [Caloramator sp.]|nr:hypothetical protein [Caloramator sp.]
MNIVELYFTVANQDILIKIANKWKININGFSNVAKVPEKILRKHLFIKFNSKDEMFYKLLEEIYGTKLKELNLNNVDDLLYTFLSYPLKEKVDPHFPLAILILLDPEFAQKNVDRMFENFNNNKHIFEGLVGDIEINEENCYEVIEKLLQLKEPIEYFSLFEPEAVSMLKLINQEENFFNLKQRFTKVKFEEFAKFFIENRSQLPDYIAVLAYISENIKDILQIPQDKRTFYNKLLADANICFNLEVYKSFEEELKKLTEKNNSFEVEIKSRDEKIKMLEKQIELLERNFENYKITKEKELEEFKKSINKSQVKSEEKINKFEGDIETTIITNYQYDRVFEVLGRCNIIDTDNTDILSSIENYEGQIFVHRNSFNSTKELLNLEKLLKSKGIKYYVIFGVSLEELIRNIIIKKKSVEGLS